MNSGGVRLDRTKAENAWLLQSPNLYWSCSKDAECDSDYFNLAAPNYELFRLFLGRLSPTEVAAVLMHALSSDSRSIFGYVKAVHYHFEDYMSAVVEDSKTQYFYRIHYDSDYDEDTFLALEDWGEGLQSIKYSGDKKTKKRKRKAT